MERHTDEAELPFRFSGFSSDLAKNVLYDQTVDLHESGDHEKALEMFTKLGDYKETSSYPTRIHLNPVIEAMKKVRSVIS